MNEVNNITQYYFALDGVIIPSFVETIMDVLTSQARASVEVSFTDIQGLTKDFYLGKDLQQCVFSRKVARFIRIKDPR